MKPNEFLYAAGYYPLMQKREDWDKDLKKMKETGIQLIRTAELFNSWDQIEPQKGVFKFEFLDEFFDLCLSYGIKILLGTGTASPPYWVHEMYPDVNILNNHNEQYPNNVSYSWACIDHPSYLDEAKRYLSTLVNRYKSHEALYAYQIHNEISFPFMPLKEGDIDIYCYCDHSIDKFREWVQNKYKTIDQLNYAYRWGATHTCHTSWNQVIPPRTKPTSWSSVTRWLDWRLFWMENMVEFIGWQNEIIKSIDDKHITTTNIFFLKSQDPLGVITALDQFEMAKVVDVIGYDLYPGSGDKLEKMSEFSSMFLDMARSTSESIGKDYWLLETESGPINGWVLGPSRNVKGFDLIRNVFEAVGHDAKLTLYQGWREWDFQPLHWGGIVDLDGNDTEHTKAAADIGKVLFENNELFLKSKTPKSKVAILISKENAIILNGMGQEEFLHKALRGAYRAFWEMNYKVDFITPELVKQGYIEKYELVYMPFLALVTKELSEGLASYVHNGGILIGTSRCGMLGQNGWYNHQIPCFDLNHVFGIKVKDVEAKVTPNVNYKKKNYKGYWHKETLELQQSTVQILARYNDDLPAITINTYGQGKAIYIGTHPDVGYLEEKSLLICELLEDILTGESILQDIDLDYTNRNEKEVDAHLLENDESAVVIITNYVNKEHKGFFNNNMKKVRMKINTDKKYRISRDLETGEERPIFMKENSLYLEIDIMKNHTKLLELR